MTEFFSVQHLQHLAVLSPTVKSTQCLSEQGPQQLVIQNQLMKVSKSPHLQTVQKSELLTLHLLGKMSDYAHHTASNSSQPAVYDSKNPHLLSVLTL